MGSKDYRPSYEEDGPNPGAVKNRDPTDHISTRILLFLVSPGLGTRM